MATDTLTTEELNAPGGMSTADGGVMSGNTPLPDSTAIQQDAGVSVDNTVSTETLAPQGDFTFPAEIPQTNTVVGATAELQDVTDTFTKDLETRAKEAQKATTDSQDILTELLNSQTGLEGLRLQAEQDTGLRAAEAELLDINDQLRREQLSMRRRIEAIERDGGGLKIGAQAEISNIQRESLSKQADLAIIQMAAQGKYDSAKQIADRKAAIMFEQEQNQINTAKFLYQENKDLFTQTEGRLFEVRLNDRERQLDQQRRDFETLQSVKLSALQMAQSNGAPTSVLSAIQMAETPEDVLNVGGQWGSVDMLEREYKRAQLAKLREKPESLLPTQIIDQGGRKLLINSQTGEVIQDFGVNEGDTTELKQAVQEQKVGQIDELRSHKGFNSSVGPFKGTRIGVADTFTGAKDDFIASVDNLTKGLTLDNLVLAKEKGATFGALSDSELKLLAESATKINNWRREKDGITKYYDASETDFMEELDRISNFAKLDAIKSGVPLANVGAWQTPDGKIMTYNGDGNITQLK